MLHQCVGYITVNKTRDLSFSYYWRSLAFIAERSGNKLVVYEMPASGISFDLQGIDLDEGSAAPFPDTQVVSEFLMPPDGVG